MNLTKNPVFLHFSSKFMRISLFVLEYMYISLLLKMINVFSWPAKIMASPFNLLIVLSTCIHQPLIWTLKNARSYFSKFNFLFHLKNHHSKDINFKSQLKRSGCLDVQFCILQLPISYCVSLIIVTITRHVFINIFQTEHFLAVKFSVGYDKNMSFLVITESPKVWKKKLKR